MKVAIRVHTPELSEAVQRMAGSYGWSWDIGDIPKSSENVLWFTNEVHRRKCITSSPENYLKGAGRRTADFILDAKTDMSQIVEFFYKTGKVKETEMGKTTIKNIHGDEFEVIREGDNVRIIGCEIFPVTELDKARKVKAKKPINIKREIRNVEFNYTSPHNLPNPAEIGQDGNVEYSFNDNDLDLIQEWLDAIKEAKKSQ